LEAYRFAEPESGGCEEHPQCIEPVFSGRFEQTPNLIFLERLHLVRTPRLAHRVRGVSPDTIGELQGNGVELDTWCAKLGLARDTLKLVRQAAAEEENLPVSEAKPTAGETRAERL
jgi:hypothetical protein